MAPFGAHERAMNSAFSIGSSGVFKNRWRSAAVGLARGRRAINF